MYHGRSRPVPPNVTPEVAMSWTVTTEAIANQQSPMSLLFGVVFPMS
jgi:hypothetical protein